MRVLSYIVHFCLPSIASYEVSEALIVRDLIFTFQGIDGKYIHFNKAEDGFRVDPQVCGGQAVGTGVWRAGSGRWCVEGRQWALVCGGQAVGAGVWRAGSGHWWVEGRQ